VPPERGVRRPSLTPRSSSFARDAAPQPVARIDGRKARQGMCIRQGAPLTVEAEQRSITMAGAPPPYSISLQVAIDVEIFTLKPKFWLDPPPDRFSSRHTANLTTAGLLVVGPILPVDYPALKAPAMAPEPRRGGGGGERGAGGYIPLGD
jgi:hypothetical protein